MCTHQSYNKILPSFLLGDSGASTPPSPKNLFKDSQTEFRPFLTKLASITKLVVCFFIVLHLALYKIIF